MHHQQCRSAPAGQSGHRQRHAVAAKLSTNGTLTNGKNHGVNIDASNGFDIGGASNMAYGIFTSGGKTKLHGIDLGDDLATPLQNFTGTVSGFAMSLAF